MFNYIKEMRAECSEDFCAITWRFDDILNKLQICNHWSYFFGSLDCGSVEICAELRSGVSHGLS